MLDLLIINGTCPDYEAGEMVKKHIGIQNGTITWMGVPEEALPEAAQVIDAEGKIVSPGFIDIHMHEDPVENGKIERNFTPENLRRRLRKELLLKQEEIEKSENNESNETGEETVKESKTLMNLLKKVMK